jgi:hypothetical protein
MGRRASKILAKKAPTTVIAAPPLGNSQVCIANTKQRITVRSPKKLLHLGSARIVVPASSLSKKVAKMNLVVTAPTNTKAG